MHEEEAEGGSPIIPRDAPSCPLCGGSTERASLGQPHAYWRCRNCGSCHLHPQPSPEVLESFYDRFHLPAEQGGVFADFEERSSADFPAKAAIVARYLGGREDGRHREAPRVLDVGCGKGYFVRELQGLGFAAEGIDISGGAIQDGRSKLGIQGLRAGRVEDQEDWVRRFHAVTAWATIEHLPSPAECLRSVGKVLKPGGLLFLDTGLAGDFVDRWAPGMIQWYDPPQHLFVFSRSGLERVLRDSGFSVIDCDLNFERTPARRVMKSVRNRVLAVAGACLFRIAVGQSAYRRMRMESKMPFGSLMFIMARLEG